MKNIISILLILGTFSIAFTQSSENATSRVLDKSTSFSDTSYGFIKFNSMKKSTNPVNDDLKWFNTVKKSTNPTENSGDDARQWFNNFYAGLGALGEKGVGEMGITLRRFELFLGTRREEVTVINPDGISKKEVLERDIIIGFNFLNRASINFDSLKFIANNYLLSLNPSPFTLRIDHSFYFTKNKKIELGKKSKPVIGLQLQGDGRAVPFAASGGSVDIGGSLNIFGTLFFQFKSYEKIGNQTKDEGMFYFEPSFYFVGATSSLMKSIMLNNKQKYITGLDFKIGFKSESDLINDIGLSGYYTWENVIGPKFRIGITVKPN